MAEDVFVDRCYQLEDSDDSLPFLKLSITSFSTATPTLRALASSAHVKEAWLAFAEGDEGVGLLCREVLLLNPSLERLRLDLKECSDDGIKEVAEVIRNKSTLKQLSLLLNNVGEEGACHLSRALEASNLEEFSIYATQLDLHDRCIGDVGVAAISEALGRNRSLKSLSIAQNGVTSTGLKSITSMLDGNHNITSLDLHSNRINSEGVAVLATSHLTSPSCDLETLILAGNHDIGNDGAKSIALSLCSNSSLKILGLQSCGIGGKGAERFATTLSQNHTLRELNLCGNVTIGDNAVELIARGLRENTALHKLDLSSCGVKDEGCAYLADALMENQTLSALLLHKNEIGDGGLIALSETLSKRS